MFACSRISHGLMGFLLLVSLGLGAGCASKTVRVSDGDEFNLMARRIPSVLKARELVDAEGAYVSALFTFEPGQVGETLFERLSPAFRFQVDPNLLPPSFAASRGPADTVEIRSNGFVMSQGAEVVSVRLIALADWNGDGADDWFVLCRVQTPGGTVLRDYYLVIENLDTPLLMPRLVAVYDCRNQTCKLFVSEAAEKTPDFTPEVRVLELDPGQQSVVPPPNAPAPAAPASGLQEQKLGG